MDSSRARDSELISVVVVIALLVSGSTPPPTLGGVSSGNNVSLTGHNTANEPNTSHGSSTSSEATPEIKIVTEAGCFGLVEYNSSCLNATSSYQARCPEEFVSAPSTVYIYHRATEELLSTEFIPGYCPSDNTTPVTLTLEDFQRLPLTPSKLNIAPENLSGYVNLPVFIHTTDQPQQLNTTILGTDILVEATPTTFTFNYGDNTTPHKTTKPGAQYPDTTNAHTYRKPGDYTVTLHTTWSGRFSTDNGTTWQTVQGTAETHTASNPITIVESTPLLTN